VTRVEVVRPSYQSFSDLKEVAMKCNRCGQVLYGKTTEISRMAAEHREITCLSGSDGQKNYEIWYPRA